MKFYFLKIALVLVLIFNSITGLKAQTVPANFSISLFKGGWSEVEGFRFDGTGQTYVYEKGGKVWVLDVSNNKLANPLIDISDEVGDWRDHGLNGFALDPNFRTNGYYYLMYTVDRYHLLNFGNANYNSTLNDYYKATIVRVTRYTADINTNFTSTIANSRLILIGETKKTGIPILHESHSGGQLVFGTDGSLMVSTGDGASYNIPADGGSSSDSYYVQALADSIIRPKENVGSFRSQIIDCLNGKLLRIDPATGDGLVTNPYFDLSNPRSAKSRVWDLGLRNPFRMTLRPGTGSTDITAGDPGVFYIGDVGWATVEDLNVATRPGMNFGWPLFEGLTAQPLYKVLTVANQDAINPLFGIGGCTQQYFQFNQLCIQDTNTLTPSFPNPCNPLIQIPSTIPTFKHARPAIDWQHNLTQARTGIWNGTSAGEINLNDPASPVKGPVFSGYASCAGTWYTGTKYPVIYQNTYFHADYVQSWIKNFKFNTDNTPDSVKEFGANMGPVVFVEYNPVDQYLYYVKYPTEIYKISYNLTVNNPPTANAIQDVSYGYKPLPIKFDGSSSTDPENLPLTYSWDFGDGSPISNLPNPVYVYNPATNNPIAYTVTLTVTDNIGQTSIKTMKVYVNDTPPRVSITSFVNGGQFTMTNYTNLPLQASVFDLESPDYLLSYSWKTYLHHNTHTHPEASDTNRITSTILTPVGCDGNIFYYRMELTVTDPIGLSTTVNGSLYPACDPPVANFSSNVVSSCNSATVNFSDLSTNLPDSWLWTFVGGSPSTSTLKNPTVTYSNPGTYSVILTSTNTRGSGSITKNNYINIYSNLVPIITANGSLNLCNGSNVILTSSSASSYLWSSGETTQSINVSTIGNYLVTTTNLNGCSMISLATSITANSISNPVITASGPTTFCNGGNVILTSIAGSNYLWSTGETTQSIVVSTSGNFTVIVSDFNSCSASSTITPVVANSIISPIITANGPTSFCNGKNVTLTSSSASNYLWSNGATTQSITVSATGNYNVTITDGNNCLASSILTSVIVNSINTPIVTPSGPTTFCYGGSVTLTSSLSSNYLWSNGATTQSILVNTIGNFKVTVTDANGCTATSLTIPIAKSGTIPATPGKITSSTGLNIACPGDIISYSIPAVSGATSYTWIIPNGSSIINGSVTNNITLSYNSNFIIFDTLRVTANNQCGSSSQKKQRISRNFPATPSAITGPIDNLCGRNNVAYNVINTSGINYTWKSPTGSTITSGQTTNTILVNFPLSNFSGNFSVIASNGCGKSSSQILAVKSLPNPPDTIYGPSSVCSGSVGNIYSVKPDPSITNFKWSGPSGSRITDGINISQYNSLTTTSNTVTVTYGSILPTSTLSVKQYNNCGGGVLKVLNLIPCPNRFNLNSSINPIEVFPNPTAGSATLKFNSNSIVKNELFITDLTGRELFSESFYSTVGVNDHLIELKLLEAGIYLLRLKNNTSEQVIRLVKE